MNINNVNLGSTIGTMFVGAFSPTGGDDRGTQCVGSDIVLRCHEWSCVMCIFADYPAVDVSWAQYFLAANIPYARPPLSFSFDFNLGLARQCCCSFGNIGTSAFEHLPNLRTRACAAHISTRPPNSDRWVHSVPAILVPWRNGARDASRYRTTVAKLWLGAPIRTVQLPEHKVRRLWDVQNTGAECSLTNGQDMSHWHTALPSICVKRDLSANLDLDVDIQS